MRATFFAPGRQNSLRPLPGGGALPWWTRSMCLSIGPYFKTAITPMTPFLLCWPILNSMTPFFTFLKSWMTPLFLSFPFTQLPPFFFKVILPNGPPFFTVVFVYLSMIDWNFLKSCSSMFGKNSVKSFFLPLFTTGYQMPPSLAVFFTPMTLLLLHLVRNGLVFTRVVYWMTPYLGEYTFYLIGPYFWLGVGTYLSLQIGSLW